MRPVFIKAAEIFDAPRAELARACRQICLDWEKRPLEPVDDRLLAALAEVQSRFGPTLTEDDLWEIAAREAERVADAAVLAEILLPKLSAAMRPRIEATPAAVRDAAPAPSEARAKSAAPLGIADLIDGMLSQQRK